MEEHINWLEFERGSGNISGNIPMGKSYWFECSKCGYRAKVSGRADRGIQCFVQTILCRDCKELYDAVTRVKVSDQELQGRNGARTSATLRNRLGFGLTLNRRSNEPPSFQTVLTRLSVTEAKRSKWVQYKAQCPVSAFHRVQIWNDPDKCPRCGLYLEKSATPFRIWE